jgi:hypothetical protein
MLQKTIAALMVLMMLVVGTSVAFAGGGKVVDVWLEDEEMFHPAFDDGRLNKFDIDAPVAIFYTTEAMPQMNASGGWGWTEEGEMIYEDVIVSLDLYGFLPGKSTIDHISCCPMAELNAMVNSATSDLILWQRDGYTLGYSVSGYFWVTAPNGYTFAWER